jgi:O-antigen/teichoic acid export membrane protein
MSAFEARVLSFFRVGIARDATFVAISQVAARGSPIMSGMIVSHFLGETAFADYSFLQMTASMIISVTDMGIVILASRAAASGIMTQDNSPAHRLSALTLLAILSSTLAALTALLLPESWLHVTSFVERATLAALAWCGIVSGTLVALMNGMRRFRVVAKSAVIGSMFTLGGAGLGSIMGSSTTAISGLILGQFVTGVLTGRALWLQAKPLRPTMNDTGALLAALRDLSLVAIPVLLTTIIWSAAMWWSGKRLLVQAGGEHEFALYAIGLQWFSAVVFIPGALSYALLPSFFGAAQENLEEARQLRLLALRGALAAAVVSVPIATGVLLLEDSLLLSRAYGLQGGELFGVLLPIMLAAVLAATTSVLGNAVVAQARQFQWLAGIIAWATIFVVVPCVLALGTSAAAAGIALLSAYGALFSYGLLLVTQKRSLR